MSAENRCAPSRWCDALPRPKPEEIEVPERVYITPSKPNSWRGAKDKGVKFTCNQLHVMEQMSIDTNTEATVTV